VKKKNPRGLQGKNKKFSLGAEETKGVIDSLGKGSHALISEPLVFKGGTFKNGKHPDRLLGYRGKVKSRHAGVQGSRCLNTCDGKNR